MRSRWALITVACAALFLTAATAPSAAQPKHGLAMYGEPALPPDFTHLPYADPLARKGGRLTQALDGSFDSLNPLILKGNAPAALVPYVVQPLMIRSLDEPFTVYGLIAKSVETPPDRNWVEYRLNEKARFSDGAPVTSADVAFSWTLLRDHGRPAQRNTYAQVKAVTTPDAHTVRFELNPGNHELPMLLSLMPIFAKHATNPDNFEETSFKMPLGSGPYLLSDINPGSSLTLKRNPDFWGKELPLLSGIYNFDELKFDFYRDPNAMFEAFKAGLYDIRIETSTTKWLTGYAIGAVRDGRIVQERVKFSAPKPMTGFIFNTRKLVFSDIRVREALATMFDFEWLNANLFANVYQRTSSYFESSELSSRGRVPTDAELKLLAPYKDTIRADILDGSFHFPVSDGSGRDRALSKRAMALLEGAGYKVTDGLMRSPRGEPLRFEIIVTTREKLQIAAAYADSLKSIGIKVDVRLADSSQYWARLRQFDFDMILETYVNSASPGNEQVNRWSTGAASREGSLNYAGIKSRAVDAMLEALLSSRRPEEFVAAARALDRALLNGFYILPLYFAPERWIARSSRVRHAEAWPKYELTVDSWWTDVP